MKSIKESEQALRAEKNKHASQQILYETVLILALTFVAQFLRQDIRMIFTFAPLIYFFIEHYARRRTWADAGFNLRAFPQALAANWFLILLVSIIIQFIVVLATKAWMPEFIDHVETRLPFAGDQIANYLPILLVGALFEEISFRVLFQERLSWFIPTPFAIGIVSVVFGIGHWSSGNQLIVLIDVLLVIVDSTFYGIIFARSKNIYATWLTHFLANLFAMGLVILL